MKKSRTNGNQKGYTLVETMVILVVLGILLSVAGGSLSAYLRSSNFKKNNDYAETIFTAAQNSFTYAKSSGKLDELTEVLDTATNNAKYGFTGGMIENGAPVATDADRMYTLVFDQGSDKFQNGEYIGVYKTVYDMIEPYVYDSDILDAVFCVEFDPVDGKILGVCYCDKAESFYYSLASQSQTSDDYVDVSNRDTDVRRELLLGYYGVDSLSARAPESTGKPVINNLQLKNQETLYLQWQLSSKYRNITNQLVYQIDLYDADTGKKTASFKVNDSSNRQVDSFIKNQTIDEQLQTLTTTVNLYDEDGSVKATKNVQFKASVTGNGVMYLTLDAVDLASDVQLQNGESANYDTTYSIKRLGLDASKLYVRMRASGDLYKSSAWKQTKTEHTYFANEETETQKVPGVNGKEVEQTKKTYGIANARHLYNIRFAEDETTSDTDVTYKQTASFSWDGKEGLIGNGNLYQYMTKVSQTSESGSKVFPTIDILEENHSYVAEQNETGYYEISQLHFARSQRAGLFGTNKGTISYAHFSNTDTNGKDYVGTACGVNEGKLQGILVDEKSNVQGENYVGGIVGSDSSGYLETIVLDNGRESSYGAVGKLRTYQGLTNRAKVSGNTFVGGILGYFYGQYNPNLSSQAVELSVKDCVNTGFVSGTEQCVGGIIGYNKKSTIENCTSEPQLLSDEKVEQLACDGDFVGGIVGFNEGGTITNCGTNRNGYVVGNRFVGGIVGFQTGVMKNSQIVGDKNSLDGNHNGTICTNQANVIGNQYVGGIVGVNADVKGSIDFQNKENTTIEITEGKSSAKIENWMNRGVVIAKDAYAGGITGYNAGTLTDCITNVDTNAVSGDTRLEEAAKIGGSGNYVGGMVGYNRGKIKANNNEKINSVVAGANYVGGIIGYEHEDATLSESYILSGTYVSGADHVGGMVGCNQSQDLLDQTLQAKPNEVKGQNYVGGVIGSNIVKITKTNTIQYVMNNPLANVTATGKYVGGFIGYYEDTRSIKIHKVKIGKKNDEITNQLNLVKGSTYVGGVIGYNKDSRMEICGVTNEAKVQGTGSENGTIEGENKAYSYVGGITGWVTKNMTLDDCSNASSGKVTGNGYYTGGLAERNSGTIENCTIASFGTTSEDRHIGGILGVNDVDGTVKDCSNTGTITGYSEVGGIASTNYGTIKSTVIEGNVTGNGSYIGGIVGYNKENGTIKSSTVAKAIITKGTYVGGIVGANEGEISRITFENSPTVQGSQYVGGFIGKQIKGDLSGLENYDVKVVATGSNAGGIVGLVTGDVKISNCENSQSVTAATLGAGGITAETTANVLVSNCINSGDITSSNGNAGGLVGTNGGTIEKGSISGGSVSAKNYLGGITAINEGTIQNVKITSVSLTQIGTSNRVWMGGIAGINHSKILACDVGAQTGKFDTVTINANMDGGNYGGVTGENRGIIQGNRDKDKMTVHATIASSNNSKVSANLGGVAGINSKGGQIKYVEYLGDITGNSGESYGYGGIAGINEADISDCGVIGGTIRAVGSDNSVANIGGIVGKNETSGTVSTCYLENLEVIGETMAYIGGFVGNNYGNVYNNNIRIDGKGNASVTNSSPSDAVTIKTSQGRIGGVIGFNQSTGKVNRCGTKSTWTVSATAKATDDGTAGIIGYNASGYSMSQLINYATVEKIITNGESKAVAGIIGRQENQSSSSSWILSQCENYGTITGPYSVGGMIGRWKYNGGTVENCKNYGDIKACASISGASLGGMVGDIYEISAGQTVSFNQDYNAGDISSNHGNIGGILGMTATVSSSNVKLEVYDCVNIGNMKGSVCGGIVGVAGGGNITTMISRCRNYGFSQNNNTMSGIAATASKTTIDHCFGVSDCSYPITNDSNAKINKSYQFAEQGEIEKGKNYVANVSIEQGTAFGSDSELKTTSIYDQDWTTRFTMKTSGSTKGAGSVTVTFLNEISLKDLEIFWYAGGSNNRQYDYTVSYWDATNQSWVQIDEKTNVLGCTNPGTSATGSKTELANAVQTKQVKFDVTKNSNNSEYISIWELKVNGDYLHEAPMTEGSSQKGKGQVMFVQKKGWVYEANCLETGDAIYDLPLNPTSITNDNKEKYKTAIDPKLVLSYDAQESGKLKVPTKLTLTQGSGSYQFSWEDEQVVAYHRVKVTIYDDANGTSEFTTMSIDVGLGNSVSIPFETSWSGKYMKITVQAISGDEKKNSEEAIYQASDGKEVFEIQRFLPTPQIHLELNAAGTYDVVVDNLSDYTTDMGNVEMIATCGSTKITFKKSDVDTNGKTGKTWSGSKNTGFVFMTEAQAVDGTGYGNSTRNSKQTGAMTKELLATNATSSATYKGFTGITPDTLNYSLTLTPQNSSELYDRSELLVEDDELGVFVSVSNSVSRIYGSTNGQTQVALSDLPAEVTSKKVMIRTYPWYSQNAVSYYSYYVANNITKEQVKTQYMEDSAVKSGYIIEKNQDETYNVIYSLLFASQDIYKKQVLVKEIDNTSTTNKQGTPVIAETIEENGDRYTFTWDQGETSYKGSYRVVIMGTKVDGEVEQVYGKDEITSSQSDYRKVTIGEETWNYTKFTITVTRLGETNSNGFVTKFGVSASKEYKVKIHLSTVGTPDVNLVSIHGLSYQVSWPDIPESNHEDFDGYIITVTDLSGKVEEKQIQVSKEEGTQKEIDLEEFAGKEIELHVIAKGDGETYKNSRENDAYRMSVPTRMDTPNVTEEHFAMKESKTDILSVKEFEEDGLTLTMQDEDRDKEEGAYVLNATIYEDQACTKKVASLDDITMEGTLSDASIVLSGISSDYAGYYIETKLRCVQSGEISSLWSAKKVFQLPKVRVQTPEIEEQDTTKITTSGQHQVGSTKEDIEVALDFDTLAWKLDDKKRSDGYELHIDAKTDASDMDLRLQTSTDGKTPYTLEKKEKNQQGEDVWKTYQATKSSESSQTGAQTTTATTYRYDIGYEETLSYKDAVSSYQLDLKGYVDVVETKRTDQDGKVVDTSYAFKVILPDLTSQEALDQVDEQAHRYTNSVTIKANPEITERYGASYTRKWERTEELAEDNLTIIHGTKVTTIKD